MRQFTELITCLSAGTSGAGLNIDVADYQHIIAQVSTASSANLTFKCVGSIEDICPTFTSAQSATNMYDFIDMIDLQNNSSIDGDTGVGFTGTDDYRMFEVNVSGLKWVNFRITARVAGSVTIKLIGVSNQ